MAELDDNTRTGLHALGLGLLVIGVPVLIIQLVDLYQTSGATPDERCLHIFRNGYLLPADGSRMTISESSRMERLGLATFGALIAGAIVTCVLYPLRRQVLHWKVGRWSTVVIFLLLAWSALTLPASEVTLEGGIVRASERPCLFGELANPLAYVYTWSTLYETPQLVTRQLDDGRTILVLVEKNGRGGDMLASTRADANAVEDALICLKRKAKQQ